MDSTRVMAQRDGPPGPNGATQPMYVASPRSETREPWGSFVRAPLPPRQELHRPRTTTVLAYLETLAQRPLNFNHLASFYDERVQMVEAPNYFTPHGATRDLAGIMQGADHVARCTRSPHYTVEWIALGQTIVSDDGSASGEVIVWFGSSTPLLDLTRPPHDVLGYLSGVHVMFLEMMDGKIIRQKALDCYTPMYALNSQSPLQR